VSFVCTPRLLGDRSDMRGNTQIFTRRVPISKTWQPLLLWLIMNINSKGRVKFTEIDPTWLIGAHAFLVNRILLQ
jgi:hypothetical protein